MSLRELTKDIHKVAEQTKFSGLLVTGRVTKEQYRRYLYQLTAIYGPIEFSTKLQGIFNPLRDDPRLPKVYQDYVELLNGVYVDTWLPGTVLYNKYLTTLINDPERRHLIKAHAYVRIMGDLSGGQLLAKTVPGAGRMFQFNSDPKEIKASLYPELTDDLADEARLAFRYFINILDELYSESNI